MVNGKFSTDRGKQKQSDWNTIMTVGRSKEELRLVGVEKMTIVKISQAVSRPHGAARNWMPYR